MDGGRRHAASRGGDDDEGCEHLLSPRGGLEPASGSTPGGTRLFICETTASGSCSVQAQSNAATVSYTTVPEPATPLLALLALGAAAAGRRSARRA